MFVKHKSMTEFGQGNYVSFPVKIKSKATDIPILQCYQDELIAAFANPF